MSVGNLKTDGQKGNNLPWQLKMLQGLQGIIDTLAAGVCCPPQTRTPVIVYDTLPGSIPDGTYGFSIANVGTGNGTFLGDTIKPGESVNFGADGINNSYAASTFTFDGTGTELLITYNS